MGRLGVFWGCYEHRQPHPRLGEFLTSLLRALLPSGTSYLASLGGRRCERRCGRKSRMLEERQRGTAEAEFCRHAGCWPNFGVWPCETYKLPHCDLGLMDGGVADGMTAGIMLRSGFGEAGGWPRTGYWATMGGLSSPPSLCLRPKIGLASSPLQSASGWNLSCLRGHLSPCEIVNVLPSLSGLIPSEFCFSCFNSIGTPFARGGLGLYGVDSEGDIACEPSIIGGDGSLNPMFPSTSGPATVRGWPGNFPPYD